MAIKQRPNNAATQHSRERFLISFRLKGRDDLVTFREAANVQPVFIRRAAAKTCIVWGVGFLDTFFAHSLWYARLRRAENSDDWHARGVRTKSKD